MPAGTGGAAPALVLDQVAAEFGFAPLTVVAGLGFLRRLAAADPELAALAATCPDYAPLLALDSAACARWHLLASPTGAPAWPEGVPCATPCAPLADWCAACSELGF